MILALTKTPYYTNAFKTFVTQKIIQTFQYIQKYGV